MESKGKIIILFIANCLFVLAAVGLAIFANMNWGKDKMQDYDMGGVVFDDLTVEYDGQPHSVSATNLPEGVSVSYDNNDRTEIGTYTVTAHFYGDEVRYNPIPDKTATLTITKPAKSRILSATGFEIDETGEPPRIYCDVPNTTESIDLSDKITVMPHRTWKLYQDLNGDNELISKSMSLELGHNKAYIIITDLINNTAEYEVDVYRLDMKSYVFKYEGQVHASGRIQEKSQLAKPETPEKPYYTFTGWAVEGSTDIVEFPYTVTEDITFVAQYAPANYKITYHLNGGTNDVNNPLYYNIESSDITLLPATRAGYVFDGWYADSEFGTQVTVIEHGSHGGKQLYAKWTAVDYNINYYLNGGQNDGRNPCHYNAEMPDILLLPATRDYYDFMGWYTDGQFGTQVTVIERGSYGEKNLYAKWTPTEYQITYFLYGGENNEGNPASYNIETPEITLLPATRAGYAFDGWYADSEFGTQITVIEHGSHGGKQIYAKWIYGSEGLIYEQAGSEYKVVGCNGNAREVAVPDVWKGLPVTAIEKGVFENCTNLEKLTLPFVGAAKEGEQNTHFGYIFGADTYENNSTAVPSSLKTVVLTGGSVIGAYAFINCKSIENLTLPDELTAIGVIAFTGCTSLKGIEIPASVTQIGGGAFYGCTGLESLIFGNGIQINTIYNITFGNCASLKSIEIPASVTEIGNNAFDGCASLISIAVPSGVTSIYSSAFRDCTALESVTFGKDSQLTYIGDNAFSSCSKLKSITIPDEVTSIGSYAFRNCTNLTKVVLGENGSLSAIGEYAFRECGSLAGIIIPNSVTSIGVGAFVSCWKLAKITLPFTGASRDEEENTYFGYIFGADTYKDNIHIPSSLKTVIITDGETIRERAFYQCANIESITISDSVTSIGSGAFERCKRLTEIEIPASVTSIATFAFYACGNLKKAAFAEGSKLTFIGSEAFAHCTSLTGIIIPSSVTQIDNEAFCFCEKLESIAFGENSELTQIGERAFYFCAFANITLPKSVTAIGNSAFGYCYKLTNIRIEENSRLSSIGFGAFWGCTSLKEITLPFVGETKDGKTNSHFGYIFRADTYEENSTCVPSSLKTVIITGGSTIDYDAFSGCASIESITLPDSLTEINPEAFMYCSSLKHITIPDGVPSLYYGTFSGCTSLKSIEIPKSLISISGNLFRSCTSLNAVYITDIASWCDIFFFDVESNPLYIAKNLYLNNTLVTTLEIPSSVTSIGLYAFYNCINLKSVTFGRNSEATFIGSSAFYGCTSLSSIMLPENLTSIGSNAFYNTAFYNNKNNWVNKVLYLDNYLIEAKTDISGSYSVNSGTTLIAGHAFYGCENLKSIKIPYGVTFIGSYAFYGCTSLSSVDIPRGVATIGGYAFYDCTSLLSIDIPSSVTSIGNSAFYNCTSLEIVTFGENSQLTSINVGMFYKCTNLKSIEIPDSVTHIGNAAFRFCENLKSVTLGENSKLTYIGAAFRGCTSLESIVIPAGVNYIHCAFADCENLKSVIFKNTSGWSVVRGVNTDSVSSSDLTNPSTAAEYLKGTYSDCDWRRAEDAESN